MSQDAGKVVWYSHFFKNFPQFVVIQTVKGFSILNEAEVGIFLEFSCFFYGTMDVGNLISSSSAFSKLSLNIWKLVWVLLKPSLGSFDHYFASVWDECNCGIVWSFFLHCLSLGLGWPFPVLWPLLRFHICWHIECSTLTASFSGFEIAQLELHRLH